MMSASSSRCSSCSIARPRTEPSRACQPFQSWSYGVSTCAAAVEVPQRKSAGKATFVISAALQEIHLLLQLVEAAVPEGARGDVYPLLLQQRFRVAGASRGEHPLDGRGECRVLAIPCVQRAGEEVSEGIAVHIEGLLHEMRDRCPLVAEAVIQRYRRPEQLALGVKVYGAQLVRGRAAPEGVVRRALEQREGRLAHDDAIRVLDVASEKPQPDPLALRVLQQPSAEEQLRERRSCLGEIGRAHV